MTTDVPSLLSFQLGLFLTQHLGLNSKDKNNAKSSDDNSCIQLMLGIYYASLVSWTFRIVWDKDAYAHLKSQAWD